MTNVSSIQIKRNFPESSENAGPFSLKWHASADVPNGGEFNMGEFETRAEAEAAVPSALVELLDQCGSIEDEEGISSGKFTVSNAVSTWEIAA